MSAVLHSTGEVATNQLRSEISAINRIDEDGFKTLAEIIFNFLLASKQPDVVLDRLNELSSETGINFSALKSIVRSLLSLFKAAGSRGITAKNIQQDLEQLGMSHCENCSREVSPASFPC